MSQQRWTYSHRFLVVLDQLGFGVILSPLVPPPVQWCSKTVWPPTFSVRILSIWSWNCRASASTVLFSPSFRACKHTVIATFYSDQTNSCSYSCIVLLATLCYFQLRPLTLCFLLPFFVYILGPQDLGNWQITGASLFSEKPTVLLYTLVDGWQDRPYVG